MSYGSCGPRTRSSRVAGRPGGGAGGGGHHHLSACALARTAASVPGRGARRFIFEGAECGGHVGPRNSFPLWEAQTEVLLDFLAEARAQGDEAGDRAARELTVLFAGGIHDERSSAMARRWPPR